MASNLSSEGKLDFRKPLSRHVWTEAQRNTACLLASRYQNPFRDFAKIFNSFFASQIDKTLFPEGLPARTIQTQYHDVLRKGRTVKVPLRSMPKEVSSMLADIEAKSAILSVSLEPRHTSEVSWIKPTSNSPSSRTSALAPNPPISHATHPTQDVIQDQPTPLIPCLSQNITPGCPVPPSPPQTPKSYRTLSPKILFRAWNPESQGINTPIYFAAGLWKSDPGTIPSPVTYDPRILEVLHRSHLSRAEIPSPVVSTFQTPLAALHRALQFDRASLTILDASKLDGRRVVRAIDVLRGNPLSSEVTNGARYDGRNEVLIWGDIPSSSVLATVSVSSLERIVASDKEIASVLQLDVFKAHKRNQSPFKKQLKASQIPSDTRTGCILGRFLLQIGIPHEVAGDLAILFAKTWRYRPSTDRYQSFLNGVNSSFTQTSPYFPLACNDAMVPLQASSLDSSHDGGQDPEEPEIDVNAIHWLFPSGPLEVDSRGGELVEGVFVENEPCSEAMEGVIQKEDGYSSDSSGTLVGENDETGNEGINCSNPPPPTRAGQRLQQLGCIISPPEPCALASTDNFEEERARVNRVMGL